MSIPEDFFTTRYLFSSIAPTNKTLFFSMLAIYILFIVAAILLSLNKSMHKPLRGRLFSFFLTIGILGFLASLFRFENITYIGSRFAMILVILVAIYWYLAIAIYSISKMPREVRLQKNQERYLKYIPKKKSKRK